MTTLAPAPQIASGAPIPAPGHMGVDYEQRVDFDRLRDYRLARARAALQSSECGAFLLFDFYNIRYTTQTWIGGALGDKMTRYALLTRDGEPMLWDFGSAAQTSPPLLPLAAPGELSRAGMLGLRGAIAPTAGLMETRSARSRACWRTQAWQARRSASTSSSRRSCSRCSARG